MALLLYNGCIHTQDPSRPQATAVAVADGHIRAAGDAAQVRDAMGSAAALDLRGRCVIPGLVDCHVHFAMWSLQQQRVDAEAGTADEVLRRVALQAGSLAAGDWVLGHGWNHNAWGGRFPTAAMLDRAAPQHPVFLRAKSGHAGWANTLALHRAGVGPQTQDPPGGVLQRDARGELTGIVLEAAQALVDRAVPEPTLAQTVDAMAAAQDIALSVGLTGVHDLDGERSLAAWQVLREQGRLRLRVGKSIPGAQVAQAASLGLRGGLGDEWLRLIGVKLFADGALGPRTAWMLAPYEGEPQNVGMPLLLPEELEAGVRQACRAGLPCLVHAIGDRANRQVLDILARARAEEPDPARPLRHRIEHAQVLHPDDLGRLAELGIVASVQPLQATSDMDMVERYWGVRGSGAYAFRTLRDRGTHLAFGSDAPVESIAPLAGIHAAVTRRRADGAPGPEGWHPQERLSVAEAVRGYTAGAALAAGEEAGRGTLSPGMAADLVVLDRDIFAVEPMDIVRARVEAVMVGGTWAYAASSFDTGE